MMDKPKVRSNRVDGKIKGAYAKLAQTHYKRAQEIASSTAFSSIDAISSTHTRMACVEDYLERAGAEAARWGFQP